MWELLKQQLTYEHDSKCSKFLGMHRVIRASSNIFGHIAFAKKRPNVKST